MSKRKAANKGRNLAEIQLKCQGKPQVEFKDTYGNKLDGTVQACVMGSDGVIQVIITDVTGRVAHLPHHIPINKIRGW